VFLKVTGIHFSVSKHFVLMADISEGLMLHARLSELDVLYSPHFTRKSLRGVSALVRFGGKVYWRVD
jgi:hypothetical protein